MVEIGLVNPKSSDNVAKVVRLAACYGVEKVCWTGGRVDVDIATLGRLPREERMKGYRDVSYSRNDRLIDPKNRLLTPVAVEVRKNSESLLDFMHPENALYIFGPEDGGLTKPFLVHCHRFVQIPTRHCLNLATAVATVLWDRQYKDWVNGEHVQVTPGEFELRGVC